MQKRVLFIGGSLFVGRVFNITAALSGDFELHVANRGHYPLELEGVTEYKCERHAGRMLARLLPDEVEFDAVIDSCAYAPGDVKIITDALGRRIKHYILISTDRVYAPGLRKIKVETDPLTENTKTLSYIRAGLERELQQCCEAAGIGCTILRPSVMYGPYNYRPYESWYIELIARKHTVPIPLDATANFNLLYVKDMARALMTIAGNELAYGEIFNLAAPERISYTRLVSDFERLNGGSFDTREVTVEEVLRENLPLPFPLTEDNIIDGDKFAKTFKFSYTSFAVGMEETFNAFYSLFTT